LIFSIQIYAAAVVFNCFFVITGYNYNGVGVVMGVVMGVVWLAWPMSLCFLYPWQCNFSGYGVLWRTLTRDTHFSNSAGQWAHNSTRETTHRCWDVSF